MTKRQSETIEVNLIITTLLIAYYPVFASPDLKVKLLWLTASCLFSLYALYDYTKAENTSNVKLILLVIGSMVTLVCLFYQQFYGYFFKSANISFANIVGYFFPIFLTLAKIFGR